MKQKIWIRSENSKGCTIISYLGFIKPLLCAKYYTKTLESNLFNPPKVTVRQKALQAKKLKARAFKYISQDHTARKLECKSMFLILHGTSFRNVYFNPRKKEKRKEGIVGVCLHFYCFAFVLK